MKLLLDTHAFLWFMSGDSALSKAARSAIEDEHNDVFVSPASLWEIAIKTSANKLTLKEPFDVLIPKELAENEIELLDISIPTCRWLPPCLFITATHLTGSLPRKPKSSS